MPNTRRSLPKNASRGEVAALEYFLRDDDQKIGFAWWWFCVRRANYRPAFSRQLKRLAARIGRPVTHVDGVLVALRFWELSMSADAAFADKWRGGRVSEGLPDLAEWGALRPLIDDLAEQEAGKLRAREWTDEQKQRGELWGKEFERRYRTTVEAFMEGLTTDEALAALSRASIEIDAVGMSRAIAMWAAASCENELIVLADHALPKRGGP